MDPPAKVSPKYITTKDESFERDEETDDINFYEEQPDCDEFESFDEDINVAGGLISNFQEKFEEIIEN